jgi:hypothetical protein
MKRNAKWFLPIETILNVKFVWLVTPQFFYAILFKAVRGEILEILNKNNWSVCF